MRSLERIHAIASKELRLNLRFPMEYFAANVVTPIKSCVLMFFLYRGLLSNGQSFGIVNQGNYALYVLIGTTCHSLFMAALYTFRSRMVTEKYWLTITATLISPASILETILGFIIGSVAIHLMISATVLAAAAILFKIPFVNFATSLFMLVIIALLGFGFGLVGTTLSLCFEGKTWIFDYCLQIIVFLSCFYYPLQTLPVAIHPLVRILPSFQASQLIQQIFLYGTHPQFWLKLAFLAVNSLLVLCVPAVLLDFSLKKYGIVGY
jgi:ABC-type polysaccharide/polyol phosphate export permease